MIEVQGACVHTGDEAVLRAITCAVAPGELVGLIGLNGSGKSTLAKLMSGALLPTSGHVVVDGLDTAQPHERARVRALVGCVGQNPADQLISTVVHDEVAFGPRNLGCTDEECEQRVARALHAVGLGDYGARETNSLSGGEQQRVAIASVLAMEPRYVVLDEVTSQLDSAARADMRARIKSLADTGVGVVLITHDPIEALMCDRLLVLDAGAIVWEGSSAALLRADDGLWGKTLPQSPYIDALRLMLDAGYPLSRGCEPNACAAWLREACERGLMPEHVAHKIYQVLAEGAEPSELSCPGVHAAQESASAPKISAPLSPDLAASGRARLDGDSTARPPALVFKAATYAYDDARDALQGCSLAVSAGSMVLVAGPSGAGKTTLASLAAGVIEPQEGTVLVRGEVPRPGTVGLSFQNPEQQLFLESVEQELSFAPRNAGQDEHEVSARVQRVAERLQITDVLSCDPFALSGGQARRVAIGGILTLDAPVAVFDEPTAGLDAPGRVALHALLRELAAEGKTVLVVSHDVEEWLPLVDEVALLRAGELVWHGPPDSIRREPMLFARAGLAAPASLQLLQALEAVPANHRRDGEAARRDQDGAPAGYGQDGAQKEADSNAASAECMPASQGSERPGAQRHVARHQAPRRRTAPWQQAPRAFGSYITGDTPLAHVDARVKLCLLLVATAALFSSNALIPMLGWCALTALVMAFARVPIGAVLTTLRPAVILFTCIVLANLVSCDGSAQVALAGSVGLSVTGAARTVAVIARIVMLVCLALCVTASTTPTELADACVRLLRPLARLGLPIGDLGIVLTMALRFIPLVAEEVERVRRSQAARGVAFDSSGIIERIRAWGSVLVPVVVGLFRRADRIAESMDARCFSQSGGTLPVKQPLSAASWVILLGGIGTMMALAIASHMMG